METERLEGKEKHQTLLLSLPITKGGDYMQPLKSVSAERLLTPFDLSFPLTVLLVASAQYREISCCYLRGRFSLSERKRRSDGHAITQRCWKGVY